MLGVRLAAGWSLFSPVIVSTLAVQLHTAVQVLYAGGISILQAFLARWLVG